MRATLIHDNWYQRYYRLSEPITKGRSDIEGDVDIVKEALDTIKSRLKPEFHNAAIRQYDNDCTMVCVSDAHTHIERLVFPAIHVEPYDPSILTCDIAGKHTMMIHGGDTESVYDDEVYLRYLCRLNGLKWEGLEK